MLSTSKLSKLSLLSARSKISIQAHPRRRKHALKIVAHDGENVFFFSQIPNLFAPLFVRAVLAGGTGEDEYMLCDEADFSYATKLAVWRIAAKDHFEYPCFPTSTLLKEAVDHGFPSVDTDHAQVLALGKEMADSVAERTAERAAKRRKISIIVISLDALEFSTTVERYRAELREWRNNSELFTSASGKAFETPLFRVTFSVTQSAANTYGSPSMMVWSPCNANSLTLFVAHHIPRLGGSDIGTSHVGNHTCPAVDRSCIPCHGTYKY